MSSTAHEPQINRTVVFVSLGLALALVLADLVPAVRARNVVLVALGVLGVLLLGRRAVTAWLVRRTRR